MKSGILIDADSWPPRYVFWCCGNICLKFSLLFRLALAILCKQTKLKVLWFKPAFFCDHHGSISFSMTLIVPNVSSFQLIQEDLSSIYSTLLAHILLSTTTMVIRVVEFSSGVYKIRKILAWQSTYPKEIIQFWELE